MFARINSISLRQFRPDQLNKFVAISCRLIVTTPIGNHEKEKKPVGVLMNDVVFDTLIRKPYEKQRHNFRHISNAKFFEVIAKHGAIDTSMVVCFVLGACALCSEFGFLSSSLISMFDDGSWILNRMFPFFKSISGDSMRHTFQLMTLLTPFWATSSVGLAWLGCRREFNRIYKEYERENKLLLEEQEEKPGFIQSCSLEDGCSMRFYGDECQNSGGHRFSIRSTKQRFYDGYGGDCSFKAEKNKWFVCLQTDWGGWDWE